MGALCDSPNNNNNNNNNFNPQVPSAYANVSIPSNPPLSKLPSTLLSPNGTVPLQQALSAPLIGLYFSAHWCGPCCKFTPVLADFYNRANSNGKKLEIIFLSQDEDESSFRKYYSTMPWLAIPYNSPAKSSIKDSIMISGIPTLLIFSNKGNIIDHSARNKVVKSGNNALEQWLAKL